MTTSTYNSYPTSLKIQAKLGLLPPEIKKQIPKATLNGFINTDFSRLFGMDYIDYLDEEIESVRQFVQDKNAITFYKKYIIFQKVIMKLFVEVPEKLSLDLKKRIVHAVDWFKGSIGFEKVLDILNFTMYKYNIIKSNVIHQCLDSPFYKCLKRHPNQLTLEETEKMKKFCLEERFEGWSLFSIAKQALFENVVCACVGTWRKYVKIFGIKFAKALNRRKKHKTGIRANKPNSLWHGDVTLFRTLDNQLHYIYIVMDNFSRRILSYTVSTLLSGQICLDNIRNACSRFLTGKTNKDDTWILLDGGPENDNHHVEGYVEDESVPLKLFFAMRDLEISNSMIERVNMTLKYSYLFRKDIRNGQELAEHLKKIIPDYNKKPHYANNGNCPDNAYFGTPIDDEAMSKRMEQAKQNRLDKNRNHNCGVC